MADEIEVLTCVNHTNLRWHQRSAKSMEGRISQNRHLTFDGELQEDGTLKPGNDMVMDPIHHLKCRLEGVNPYNPNIKADHAYKEWSEVMEFVEYVTKMAETYSFECNCPASDLTVIGTTP